MTRAAISSSSAMIKVVVDAKYGGCLSFGCQRVVCERRKCSVGSPAHANRRSKTGLIDDPAAQKFTGKSIMVMTDDWGPGSSRYVFSE
jgi:hypothetical protein